MAGSERSRGGSGRQRKVKERQWQAAKAPGKAVAGSERSRKGRCSSQPPWCDESRSRWRQVIADCTSALTLDPSNWKALVRRQPRFAHASLQLQYGLSIVNAAVGPRPLHVVGATAGVHGAARALLLCSTLSAVLESGAC